VAIGQTLVLVTLVVMWLVVVFGRGAGGPGRTQSDR
jgi:hypothetical protein